MLLFFSTQNTSLLNSATLKQPQQNSTPSKINTSKFSANESFDDDDDDDTNVDATDTVTTPVKPSPTLNGTSNYDVTHPKLQKLNLNQYSTEAQYEPIDSPPLTGNSVTANYRQDSQDFDLDNEQVIGKALVIYEFKGTVQNAISIIENETLNVLEKDSGDGWTLVKRNNTEKGYVPTDYIRIEYF